MKVNGNFSLLKLIYQTDSLYNLNNNIFIRQVIDKEQYGSREKLFRIAGEKKKNKALKRIKE
jgi:hypothetical protein